VKSQRLKRVAKIKNQKDQQQKNIANKRLILALYNKIHQKERENKILKRRRTQGSRKI
jgi:chorismate mutase